MHFAVRKRKRHVDTCTAKLSGHRVDSVPVPGPFFLVKRVLLDHAIEVENRRQPKRGYMLRRVRCFQCRGSQGLQGRAVNAVASTQVQRLPGITSISTFRTCVVHSAERVRLNAGTLFCQHQAYVRQVLSVCKCSTLCHWTIRSCS